MLGIANAISRKVLLLEARDFYQLIEYNEKIIWCNLKKKSFDLFLVIAL